MSANTHTTETTTERKPPTIADIVREKTGDGALIIDFFTDVMTGRIEGAELCHRIDAAKQLVKYGSKDAAEFLAKYKGVPCGHSTRGRPNQADPCSAEERTLVAVTLNAPATLTRDFLTVLSGIDEFLMARLIRAQTADGVTVIEFLDDVMQDRTDGFRTHHRIAAAKELIVHIIRDEHPSHTPSPSTTPSPLTGEGWGEGDTPVEGRFPRRQRGTQTTQSSFPRKREPRGAGCLDPARLEHMLNSTHPSFPAKAGTQGRGVSRPSEVGAHAELNSSVVPAKAGTQGRGVSRPSEVGAHAELNSPVVPAKAGTQGRGVSRPSEVGAHAELNSSVVPAKAGTQGGGGARNTPANPARTEPVLSTAEGSAHPEPGSQLETKNSKLKTLPARRTRTQRRRDGNARAAIRRKALGSEHIEEEKDEKPAAAELTISERRISEKLNQHWHEPDPWAGPIDSTTPGRSPP